MDRKTFFQNIDSTIRDWKSTNFTSNHKTYVPGLDDGNLTYGNGEEKKGVELNTCVFFVDIRNSVALTQKHQIRTMGKIYSVFTQCILMAADLEGGFVRNIIGDRVMVVFPEDDCYTKAVNCAITINHIAKRINEIFDNVDFKCGIGIDYGTMHVMKVGLIKKGAENDDNKGLVWVGYPANFASRLTDSANKEFKDIVYAVDADFYEYNYFNSGYFGRSSGWCRKTKELTADELSDSLIVDAYGRITSKSFVNQRSIERKEKTYKYNPILISDNVYNAYKRLHPHANSIVNGWWHKETRKIRDISFDVWGADLTWAF